MVQLWGLLGCHQGTSTPRNLFYTPWSGFWDCSIGPVGSNNEGLRGDGVLNTLFLASTPIEPKQIVCRERERARERERVERPGGGVCDCKSTAATDLYPSTSASIRMRKKFQILTLLQHESGAVHAVIVPCLRELVITKLLSDKIVEFQKHMSCGEILDTRVSKPFSPKLPPPGRSTLSLLSLSLSLSPLYIYYMYILATCVYMYIYVHIYI